MDTGKAALDPPLSFRVYATSYRGYAGLFDGFDATSGTYDTSGASALPAMSPLFVSSTDSHLEIGSPAMDTGIDPGSINSMLSAGTSLDGVSRTGRAVDRGAYEQGI
jgi:hypothetical protein